MQAIKRFMYLDDLESVFNSQQIEKIESLYKSLPWTDGEIYVDHATRDKRVLLSPFSSFVTGLYFGMSVNPPRLPYSLLDSIGDIEKTEEGFNFHYKP